MIDVRKKQNKKQKKTTTTTQKEMKTNHTQLNVFHVGSSSSAMIEKLIVD
jgi:hypothetical protein